MKILSYITANAKTIMALIIVALLILLFLKPCNKDSETIARLKSENKLLEENYKADSIAFAIQVSRWQDSINRADINSDLQVKVIRETEKKLQASQSDIAKLTAIIKSQPRPVDSSFVLVAPEYKEACDSLPPKIEFQNTVITELRQDIHDLERLMNYEVIYRDSLIEDGKEYIDSLRADYNTQKGLLSAAIKAAKPRGKVLGGLGIMGNQQYLLSGANVKLGYQDKKGKIYLLSGHVMKFPPMPNPQLMAEVSVLFKLF